MSKLHTRIEVTVELLSSLPRSITGNAGKPNRRAEAN